MFVTLSFGLLEVACDGTIAARGIVQAPEGRPLRDASVALSRAGHHRAPYSLEDNIVLVTLAQTADPQESLPFDPDEAARLD